MWGSLLLTAALAAARQGDTSQAWELLGQGKTAAQRLGAEHADLHTIFAPPAGPRFAYTRSPGWTSTPSPTDSTTPATSKPGT